MEEDNGAVDEEVFCERYFICRTRDCKEEYYLDHSSSDLQILPIFHWSTRAYGVTINVYIKKNKEKEGGEFLFFLKVLAPLEYKNLKRAVSFEERVH
jgi:hypothetical protein